MKVYEIFVGFDSLVYENRKLDQLGKIQQTKNSLKVWAQFGGCSFKALGGDTV